MKTQKRIVLPIIVVISVMFIFIILNQIIGLYPFVNLCSITNPDVLDDRWLDCANAKSFIWIHLFEFTILLVETIGIFMWKRWAFGFGIFSYGALILTNIPELRLLLPLICLILVIISKKEFIAKREIS